MMKVNCAHGFYKFYPENIPAIKLVKDIFGMELVQDSGGFYTFAKLRDLPNFCIKNQAVGLGIAKGSFGGTREDILRLNSLVYDIVLDEIVEISAAAGIIYPLVSDLYTLPDVPQAGNIFNDSVFNSFFGELDVERRLVKIESFYA